MSFVFALIIIFALGIGCSSSIYSEAQIKRHKEQVRLNESFWAAIDSSTLLEKSSMVRVSFSEGCGMGIYSDQPFEVTGTPMGAVLTEGYIVEYETLWGLTDRLTLSLDIKEWHDFLTSLFNSGIKEWKARYQPSNFIFDGCSWGLEMSYDGYSFKSGGYEAEPPELSAVRDLIYGLRKKMVDNAKEKMNDWIKREYERRFGEVIPDFERSVTNVRFCIDKSDITVSRMNTGVFLAYIRGRDLQSEISIWDWLDFVKGLGESLAVADDGGQDGTNCMELAGSYLAINVIGEKQIDTLKKSVCSPIAKVLEDMKVKIERYTDRQEWKNILTNLPEVEYGKFENEYQKRFETSVSEFEKSIFLIKFRDSSSFIELRREESNIFATAYKNTRYEALLNMDDWIDVVYVLRDDQVLMRTGIWEPGEWMIDLILSDGFRRLKFGGETYPPNWEELSKVMSVLESKIIENAYNK